MSVGGRPLEFRRFKAPAEDRGTLIAPPPERLSDVLATNAQRRSAGDYDFHGRRRSQLAAAARQQLLEEAGQYSRAYRDVEVASDAATIFLAGHQPELFHPGVWFKNFVLGRLAAAHHGVGVNLLIDNDLVEQPGIRVPGGTIDLPTLETILYDTPNAAMPWEERPILDSQRFESFGAAVCTQIAPLVDRPAVCSMWPLVVERARATGNLGLSLAQGRHRLEGAWGLETLELPLSRLCGFEAFHWFVAHLLAELPRFQRIYNDSLLEYRRAARIRSRSHPVPELATAGDWLEAPFWIWQTEQPRRRRLFVARDAAGLRLGDRNGLEVSVPHAADGDAANTVEALAALAARGVKLRPRALLTTMFARLILGDVFFHGIGGAKYDELTDLIVRRFFGVEPPELVVVSATLRLPIERPRLEPDAVQRIERQLRELHLQPEKHLPERFPSAAEAEQAARLVCEKSDWIAQRPARGEGRQRHEAIERINAALQPWMTARRAALLEERERVERQLRAEHVLAWREYAFCLYPERTLRDFLLAFSAPRP